MIDEKIHCSLPSHKIQIIYTMSECVGACLPLASFSCYSSFPLFWLFLSWIGNKRKLPLFWVIPEMMLYTSGCWIFCLPDYLSVILSLEAVSFFWNINDPRKADSFLHHMDVMWNELNESGLGKKIHHIAFIAHYKFLAAWGPSKITIRWAWSPAHIHWHGHVQSLQTHHLPQHLAWRISMQICNLMDR